MDLLGAPLDALVFRYSAAVAGSIGASLDVLAIAIGHWRIRALRFISSVPPSPPDPTETGAGCFPARAPKARFMTFFDADDRSDENDRGDGEETEDRGGAVGMGAEDSYDYEERGPGSPPLPVPDGV